VRLTETPGTSVTVAAAEIAELATDFAVTVTVCCVEILDGAVYRPDEEILPTAGLRDHVTEVFDEPETVAVYCWVCPWVRLTVDGLMLTETGFSVTVAVAVLAEFALDVAVTVTVC